jgi:hypothetical protein
MHSTLMQTKWGSCFLETKEGVWERLWIYFPSMHIWLYLGGDQGNLRESSQELWLCTLHFAYDWEGVGIVLLSGTRNTTPWELRMTYGLPWRKGEQRHLEFHLLELRVEEGNKDTSHISYLEDFQLVVWDVQVPTCCRCKVPTWKAQKKQNHQINERNMRSLELVAS